MWTIIKTIKPLVVIFWMTLHATSALAATLILNTLGKTDHLTPETTSTLNYLHTTATLYYQKLAITTVETYAYQLTPYWEFLTQTTLQAALQLTHNPTALATIAILAMITAIIRYTLVLYLLRAETTPQPHTATYQRATQLACFLVPASTQPPKPKTFFQYLRRFSGFLMYLVLK